MYRVDRCPCCGGRELAAWGAGVAPFVASYALRERPRPTRLLECAACGFRFFETRYTDEEAGRLYADYRGEAYFRARNRHEPWYTRRFHDGVAAHGRSTAGRRAEVAAILARHAEGRALGSVLDYGGDRGQYLPEGFGARHVFDISGVAPEPGIAAYATREELAGRTFDAIVVSQVLEHVSDPADVLDHVRSLAAPGAIVAIDVPDERFDLRFALRDGQLARGLARALGVPGLGTALDFWGSAFRVRLGVIPPLGVPRMHEHVSFFDGRSLAAALEKRGLEVLRCERTASAHGSVWLAVARAPA